MRTTMENWIPIDHSRPRAGEEVIMYDYSKWGVRVGSYVLRKVEDELVMVWSDLFGNSCGNVTHWMRLPDPPEGL